MNNWTRKQEVLSSLSAYIAKHTDKADRADLDRFADAFYADASPVDIVAVPVERLYAVAERSWRVSTERHPGKPFVVVENPGKAGAIGDQRTAIFLVNDDMPFLVDSITGGLTALGHNIQLLYHPIFVVERDAAGKRQQTLGRATPDTETQDDIRTESIIYIEIDRRGPKTRAKIERELEQILSDVYAAVEDWRSMLAQLEQAATELRARPPAIPEDQLDETVAFLDWLRDDHFTLLGYRFYSCKDDFSDPATQLVPGKGLGILRDPERMIWRGAGGFTHMSPELAHFLMTAEPMLITKANVKATVHRRIHMDYIGVKTFDANGQVIGEHRFVGLFTSASYSRQARHIPLLRRKVAEVVERARFDARSHAGKALDHILESFPRDELFQIDTDTLYETVLGILYLQERPRPKVFLRRDPFERFVSALVYLPRDVYDGEMRAKVGEAIALAFRGEVSTFYIELSQESMARIHFIIRTRPGMVPQVDNDALDSKIANIVKGWYENLRDALIVAHGENEGRILYYAFEKAFSAAYREQFTPDLAVIDLAKLDSLKHESERAYYLYRKEGEAADTVRLKIYRLNSIIPLSDCLPMLEHLGLKVIEEFPYDLRAGKVGWIHDFLLIDPTGAEIDVEKVAAHVEAALSLITDGMIDDDGYNALILRAGLEADDVAILRAYGRYLRQIGLPFSQEYLEDCLVRHADIAAKLVALFRAKFDPDQDGGKRADAVAQYKADVAALFEQVVSLDQDRILRNYLNVIDASVRTNFFQVTEAARRPSFLTFKILSGQVKEMPKPVPYAEIFVYDPRVEGVHLRGGLVARGGLRWSDRREDYRTEILGLVKAQMVKNAVIVPVGAKGGFIPRQLPSDGDRDAIIAEGIEAYKIFIAGLIELTDNLVDGKIVPPPRTVRHDGDDPYLVVAADKGTATFSDIANGLSEAHGFWLGDAFASGGSKGYDHKKMGITAKGAWVSVQRHFREMGVNTQEDPVRVIGVGDMSGDVFGNGMLLSQSLKLVAAFDHRHIFIDPDPDAKKSYVERQRLFNLPRSSWDDYDKKLISKGGGVFDRKLKSIPLSPETQALLGSELDRMTPQQLMSAILKCDADLLWFGGIGTYVKAAAQSNGEAGDRANDAIRVNAEDLKVKVIGEGANLGVTQAARIAFARRGGRINTDFIDNSAGVDCSDNEVNLKIALSQVVNDGAISSDQRDQLLVDMTEEVSALVLRDNYLQTQAISMAEATAIKSRDRQVRLLRWLEKERGLDREVEGLPSDEILSELASKGQGLSRPEIAVLMCYAKIALFDALKDSDLIRSPSFEGELYGAFPRPVRERFPDAIAKHRLRNEIIATKLANALVNRAGLTLAFDLLVTTGYSLSEIAASFLIVRDVFDMRSLWRSIDGHDYHIPANIQTLMHIEAANALRRQMSWFLSNAPRPLDVAATIDSFKTPVTALLSEPAKLLSGLEREGLERQMAMYMEQGVPRDVAERIAAFDALGPACDIVQAAQELGRPVADVGGAFFTVGHKVGFDWLRAAIDRHVADDHWERLACNAISEDIADQQRALTRQVLEAAGGQAAASAVEDWAKAHAGALTRCGELIAEISASGAVTLAKLGYAARAVRSILARF